VFLPVQLNISAVGKLCTMHSVCVLELHVIEVCIKPWVLNNSDLRAKSRCGLNKSYVYMYPFELPEAVLKEGKLMFIHGKL
jgi:hypothetical protein